MWRESIPRIPASRLDPIAEDDGVLMWVRRGALAVNTGGPRPLRATAGQAVWVPPGVTHSARLDDGGVVVPIIVEAREVPAEFPRAGVVAVPPEWDDWLMYRLSRWFGFASGAENDVAQLFRLLAGAASVHGAAALPPLPRSAGARSVIERLHRDPADASTLAELAAGASLSARTLQRRLGEETGCSLAGWRTAIRIAAALEHVSQGRDIGWIAHHVGYASVSGFAHAFSDRMGVSPGRFAAGTRATRADGPLDTLAPPPIPAVPPATGISLVDSVLWVYRGAVSFEIAGRRVALRRGDVLWLPQGMPHGIEIEEASILLPLGWKPAGRRLRVDSPRVVRMPDELTPYLLHTIVANHFLLRPPGHNDQSFLEGLAPAGHPVPESAPQHLDAIVSAVIRNPADRRGLAEWAGDLAVDPVALRRDFAAVMGESFPRWRARARMSEARALMGGGHAPSAVARRLGYAHLPAFSKAFTAAHGIPPREWFRREAG